MIPLLFLVYALWIGDRKSTWNDESHHLISLVRCVVLFALQGRGWLCQKSQDINKTVFNTSLTWLSC